MASNDINSKTTVMLLGPSLTAVSGVSTHLNQLFQSTLADEFHLLHFQVGSQGRKETVVSKLARFLFSPFQFFLRLFQDKSQIVHLNTALERKSYWRDIVYLFIARIMKQKIVYQIHGGVLPQEFFRNNKVLNNFLRWVLRSSDVVVLLAQKELHAYRDFAPSLYLEVIPNAIEIDVDTQWKQNQTAQTRTLQLIYMGRLVKEKGIFDILEALAIVCNHGKSVELVIAGSGPEEVRLRTYVTEMGLDKHVSFVGAVFGKEKNKLWEEADLFVFPTYHREGLPYVLLESMAARTPPVVSPVAGISDVMEDGVHGLFVPSRNPQVLAAAIERFDNDRALIRRMGEAGRQRIVDQYTVSRLAEDFRRVYGNLLNA